MTTTTMEDRIKRYNYDDIRKIFSNEGLSSDDMSFLCAISNYAAMYEVPGEEEPKLGHILTSEVPVFVVDDAESGIFFKKGSQPVIILNPTRSVMDYDFISHLHPQNDWDVYLWLDVPWSATEEDLGVYGEWYRRHVHKDGIEPFDGTLGWADIAVKQED